MEMMHIRRYGLAGFCLCICILLCSFDGFAQPGLKKYSIHNGSEIIELSKSLPEKELDEFIINFDLGELNLKHFIRTNKPDSLSKRGWLIVVNTAELLVISRPMNSINLTDLLLEKVHFSKFPFGEDNANTLSARYGSNKFKNKYPFREEDSVVVFFLKNNKNARQVLLAANFTNWQNEPLPMRLTDSGWIAYVKLGPGKYWYKFIVDGEWITDEHNQTNENDGEGNTNSVFYKTNVTFSLNGFTDAKRVYLSGSFNEWREKEMQMTKTATGWQLPVLLPEGTHTYKFIVDKDWYADEKNPVRLPDGHGGYNSVVQIGKPYIFKLNGFTNAKQVILAGSFNAWKEDELQMNKTATGWELPYVIGAGNYEYKFIVDGKWISDPANQYTGNDGNSYLVVSPNYTFKLKDAAAKKVYVAGDFNGWNPTSLPMIKQGDTWTFNVFLAPGKHRYKFIVDGEWIRDPANKLWEENEWETGNSIVWIGQ